MCAFKVWHEEDGGGSWASLGSMFTVDSWHLVDVCVTRIKCRKIESNDKNSGEGSSCSTYLLGGGCDSLRGKVHHVQGLERVWLAQADCFLFRARTGEQYTRNTQITHKTKHYLISSKIQSEFTFSYTPQTPFYTILQYSNSVFKSLIIGSESTDALLFLFV